MVEVAAAAELTSSDLVALAKKLGLRASPRLITDWVALGLLDQPRRRGLGRGKGVTAVWPTRQAELFIDLLTLRQEREVQHVASLANLPVLGWLYGDPAVPLRQARRALATWCGKHRKASGVSDAVAKRAARQLIETLDHNHTSVRDRADLRRIVVDSMRAEAFDRDAFREAVQRVFDPHDEGLTTGPQEAPTSTEAVVRLTEARFTALNALESLSDEEYEDARLIYVATRTDYARKQPGLAADSHSARLFEEPDLNQLLNNSCRDLLTILGMGRLSRGRQGQLAEEARSRAS